LSSVLALTPRGSRGEELAGAPSEAGIGAGVEGGHDAASHVVIVGEFGHVLVGEVGGPVQLLPGEQAENLGLLALEPGVDVGCWVVVGWPGFHESMVVGGAGGSLSVDWLVTRLRS
jgi:hypothetical protein